MNYDLMIFQAVNGLARRFAIADMVGIFLAEYLPYVLIIVLSVFAFWPKKDVVKNRIMIFLALFSGFFSRYVLKAVILFFYSRPRPYAALAHIHQLVSMKASESWQAFPSGHTMFFFALAASVYFFNKKSGIFFFFGAAIVALARIFVGVHWPSDVAAGAVLGIFTAFLVQKFYLKYKDKIDGYLIYLLSFNLKT